MLLLRREAVLKGVMRIGKRFKLGLAFKSQPLLVEEGEPRWNNQY